MVAAARKAGRALIRDFGELENLQVSLKGPADFVSTADERTERILIEELSRARPGYAFLGEETGSSDGPDKSHRFIIDPIDGTTNFLHGIPIFAISIALEREGQLVSAVVFNPVTDEMYVAEKGHGAYLNDKRLRVAARKSPKEALFATGIPFMGRPGHERFLAELKAVMAEARRASAAAARPRWTSPAWPPGRFDGFWERGLNAWDMAAGILLVREAGGVVTRPGRAARGRWRPGDMLASNEALHPQFLKLLTEAGRATRVEGDKPAIMVARQNRLRPIRIDATHFRPDWPCRSAASRRPAAQMYPGEDVTVNPSAAGRRCCSIPAANMPASCARCASRAKPSDRSTCICHRIASRAHHGRDDRRTRPQLKPCRSRRRTGAALDRA